MSPTWRTSSVTTGGKNGVFCSSETTAAHGTPPGQSSARSAPVKAATTPGLSRAAETSSFVTFARAKGLLDVFLARGRVLLEVADGSQDHAGRAVPALQGMVLVERRLHGMPVAVGLQALDRRDLVPVGLYREERARLDGLPLHQHGAGPAVGGVAPDHGPRQVQALTQVMHQEQPRLDLVLVGDAVYVYLDPSHLFSPFPTLRLPHTQGRSPSTTGQSPLPPPGRRQRDHIQHAYSAVQGVPMPFSPFFPKCGQCSTSRFLRAPRHRPNRPLIEP